MSVKARLKEIIERHRGRRLAITAKDLAVFLGENERHVRLMIRELIAEDVPIASATDSPAGYFIAVTYQEVEDYRLSLKSRLIEDALRMRDVRRGFRRRAEAAVAVRMI
ncbi:MAG: hypothetical protein WC455_29065 [Dehalococcoidia bacterium]|jgi:hypothetical protein